jgi:hypothetical protein
MIFTAAGIGHVMSPVAIVLTKSKITRKEIKLSP